MKDLANFLGPFAHLHTLWPESILSAASVVGHLRGCCAIQNFGFFGSHRGVCMIFDGNLMIIMTKMFFMDMKRCFWWCYDGLAAAVIMPYMPSGHRWSELQLYHFGGLSNLVEVVCY